LVEPKLAFELFVVELDRAAQPGKAGVSFGPDVGGEV
jgi:hypothetical protein